MNSNKIQYHLHSHQSKLSTIINRDEVQKVQRQSGLALTEQEKQMLLPHFFMIVVGKPGSGKTTIIERLLTRSGGYTGKFDYTFLVSPSKNKMGLPLPQIHTTNEFSLEWIYHKIQLINEKTAEELDKHLAELRNGLTGPYDTHAKTIRNNQQSNFKFAPSVTSNEQSNSLRMFVKAALTDKRELKARQMGTQQSEREKKSVYQEIFVKKRQEKALAKEQVRTTRASKYGHGGMLGDNAGAPIARQVLDETDELEKEMKKVYSVEKLNKMHKNILFVFDDVIGAVKQLQNDQYLAQLFFNRRHLLANGTVSIILVSQKYSMIPARLRSNASWLLMFKLNPNDNRIIYEDVFTGTQNKWEQILQFVFGDTDSDLIQPGQEQQSADTSALTTTKFNNLGVWIERDKYFKNFELISQQ